jgi:hypothetical protein
MKNLIYCRVIPGMTLPAPAQRAMDPKEAWAKPPHILYFSYVIFMENGMMKA